MTASNSTVGSLVGEMVRRAFDKKAFAAALRAGIVLGLFLVAARVMSSRLLGETEALSAIALAKVFAVGVGLVIALQVLQSKASRMSIAGTLVSWLIVPLVLFVVLRQQTAMSAESVTNAAVLAAGSLACMLYVSRAARRSRP